MWTGIEDKFGLRVLLVPKCVLQGQPHAVLYGQKGPEVRCKLGASPVQALCKRVQAGVF